VIGRRSFSTVKKKSNTAPCFQPDNKNNNNNIYTVCRSNVNMLTAVTHVYIAVCACVQFHHVKKLHHSLITRNQTLNTLFIPDGTGTPGKVKII